MSDISRDDIQRAIREELRDLIRNVEQIERRTDDLDQTQEEIRRLAPQLERVARQMEETHQDVEKIDRLAIDMQELKSQLMATQQYLRQVAQYLEALDQRERGGQDDDSGYRKG